MRTVPTGPRRGHVRFAALGDSATCGLGDADVTGAWRGWARILADAIGQHHDVSFCNLAVPGSTVASVRQQQLPVALTHGPQLASLIVGLNDTMQSTWNADAVRADLLHCADRLTEDGALFLTARFHDHTRLLRLPRLLARPMRARIDALNDVYDEIYYLYGGLRLDLEAHPGINDRRFWSIDRLHPSELGHRALAHEHFSTTPASPSNLLASTSTEVSPATCTRFGGWPPKAHRGSPVGCGTWPRLPRGPGSETHCPARLLTDFPVTPGFRASAGPVSAAPCGWRRRSV